MTHCRTHHHRRPVIHLLHVWRNDILRISPRRLPYLTFLSGLTLVCLPAVSLPALAAGPGPSLVSVSGRQLLVRKRNLDGSLGPESAYIIRGVNWSPAS